MSEEIRTVSKTGGRKGQKEARYDLIPGEALEIVAKMYGRGAIKYTEYGECTCQGYVDVKSRPMREDSADPATSENSSRKILSTQRDSVRITGDGNSTQRTWKGNDRKIGSDIEHAPKSQEHIKRLGSPEKSMKNSSLGPVEYVDKNPSTWTMTTPAAEEDAGTAYEEGYATDATSGWGISKGGSERTNRRHEDGCDSLRMRHSGERNWEKGYDWSLSFAALNRHLWQFWNGEDIDEEMGLPHLSCVVFHAMALLQFQLNPEKYAEFDNRPNTVREEEA